MSNLSRPQPYKEHVVAKQDGARDAIRYRQGMECIGGCTTHQLKPVWQWTNGARAMQRGMKRSGCVSELQGGLPSGTVPGDGVRANFERASCACGVLVASGREVDDVQAKAP